MNTAAQWHDLIVRMGSGAVMLAIGLAAVAAGGDIFHGFVALICGAMVWELVRMLAPGVPNVAWQLGLMAGIASMVAIYLPAGVALPLLMAPAIVGLAWLDQHRRLYMIFVILVLLAGFGMMSVRDDFGFVWMLWLALVVVSTDVAGYFAGRMLGGPRFWPRVSPKKTWSGTVAGWIAAALVGLVFALTTKVGLELIGISAAVSMASQMGDISESAVKRKMGVKDSSSLIPGHGGLLDRFDGMLGASVFLLIVGQIIGFPPGLA
ncbi:phosphatidate cytidylyltransferase [Aestuariivita sp.]|jgi:phosphatidate cytidylyltransferase|uniref:phosphatidate cytidylyltransferase n=1 Tax=Aestuariivita sp. TaxID=1872407 RepID=UPI00216D5C9A|nr:phosphatidate cytidylyltransferase [Aestuariivita sp.]MCE8006466.1 phosphatidate cytidylyltransferase [Aestuariivita sp.]